MGLMDLIGDLPSDGEIGLDSKLHAAEGVIRSLEADVLRLKKVNQRLRESLDTIAAIASQDVVSSRPVKDDSSPTTGVIPVVFWSDWHVAEKVDKSKTNGRNEFNPEVADARAKVNTESVLKLLKLIRLSSSADEMVLILGGDFITGYLHPELAETNCMGPVEEAYFAQSLLERELNTLISNAALKKIRIVYHRGNHGRTTKKVQYKNDYETSYETWIGWNLRDRVSGDGVEWVIPKSDVHYTELIKDVFLRTIHGHQIKYAGGIGGIAVPLNRWVAKQDQTQTAISTLLGHFHTYTPAGRFAINGSLKGWDEFAQSLGFPFEYPCQMMQLFDVERVQMTVRYPVFCE
jgi:hypothetical protein